jgi:Zn finger protein HypA/HybF involved in hydrogenase expression
MADNYDSVCAICGQTVNADTLYYCCPKCHKTHKEKRSNNEVAENGNANEKEVFNGIVESESKQP